MSGILTPDFYSNHDTLHARNHVRLHLTCSFIVSYPRYVVADHPEPHRLPGQDGDVGLVRACAMRPCTARNSHAPIRRSLDALP